MNHAVYWRPPADAQMLGLLVRAADKQQLLRAAREIEGRLRRDPTHEGEGRDGDRRILFVRPLCVLFTVEGAEQTVYVEAVRWVGT